MRMHRGKHLSRSCIPAQYMGSQHQHCRAPTVYVLATSNSSKCFNGSVTRVICAPATAAEGHILEYESFQRCALLFRLSLLSAVSRAITHRSVSRKRRYCFYAGISDAYMFFFHGLAALASKPRLKPYIIVSLCIAYEFMFHRPFSCRAKRRLRDGSLTFAVCPDGKIGSIVAAASSFDHNGWSLQHTALTHLSTASVGIRSSDAVFTSSTQTTPRM